MIVYAVYGTMERGVMGVGEESVAGGDNSKAEMYIL